MEQTLEFFKLSETDRKVFFWLIDRVNVKAIKSWIDYIAEEYAEKSITINANLLFKEVLELRPRQSVSNISDVIAKII